MNRNEFLQEIDRAVERLVEEITEIARRTALQEMQAWFERQRGASRAAAPRSTDAGPAGARESER